MVAETLKEFEIGDSITNAVCNSDICPTETRPDHDQKIPLCALCLNSRLEKHGIYAVKPHRADFNLKKIKALEEDFVMFLLKYDV